MSDIDWDGLPDPLAELEEEVARLRQQVKELVRRLREVERRPEPQRPHADPWRYPWHDPNRPRWTCRGAAMMDRQNQSISPERLGP